MSILIKKKGTLSTIQDHGRTGYREFGVNVSGPMDTLSVRSLNILLGNSENAPVIEMHFPADIIEFEQECLFAVGGADFGPQLNGSAVPCSTVHSAWARDVLSFKNRVSGSRTYLAVRGGFCGDQWLSSQSTNLKARLGGFNGRALNVGDRVDFVSDFSTNINSVGLRLGPSLSTVSESPFTVRAVAGPEFELLTGLGQETLFSTRFRIASSSDRMGFRLSGKPLYKLDDCEILSSAVTFGTVQLLPDGQMIVLMADHQTTGGYPRILTVAAVDLPALAQFGAGDEIGLRLIGIDEAEKLLLEQYRGLAFLKTGVQLRLPSRL